MAEAAEVPEARDPFERRVALTIAVLAVVLSVISTIGDNAKSDALLSATRASNRWAHFQSKSIKEHSFAIQRDTLRVLTGTGVNEEARNKLVDSYGAEVSRYEKEKDQIKLEAEKLEKEVEAHGKVNDRCDLAQVMLQVAIVMGSVAILVRWKGLWIAGLLVGLAGAATGFSALL